MGPVLLLADDNCAVRSALELILERCLDLHPSGEATNLEELCQLASQTAPDLILLDWELPGFRSEPSLKKLHALAPGVKVVALSSRLEDRAESLAAGVDAFISMGESPEAFLQTMRKLCPETNAPGKE
jgi:DNA-binding NarL/FixJ family response regulator